MSQEPNLNLSDEDVNEFIMLIIHNSCEMPYVVFCFQISLRQVASNGYKQYMKSRPCASSESVKRSKLIDTATLPFHPLFSKFTDRTYTRFVHLCPEMHITLILGTLYKTDLFVVFI